MPPRGAAARVSGHFLLVYSGQIALALRHALEGWSLFKLKNRSVIACRIATRLRSMKSFHSSRSAVLSGLMLVLATLGLTSCKVLYKVPQNTFAGRPVPPSQLFERVLVGVTTNGSQGFLEILDGLRDIRGNIQDTKQTFSISGYSGGYPSQIYNFPEQSKGFVYSSAEPSFTTINYGTEAAAGVAAAFPAASTAIAVSADFVRFFSAEENAGFLTIVDNSLGTTFALNLPNVFQVVINQGDTAAIAMTRNSNSLYRIVKLNANQYTTAAIADAAIGAIDCQPLVVPVYCVVPVPGSFDRPSGAYFSLDGSTAYVLNSGPELGGTTASVSLIPQAALVNTNIPTAPPTVSPVTATIPIPGGVTTSISDGTTLYLAGQSQSVIGANGQSTGTANPNGLFGGYLTTLNLSTNQVTGAYSISDGHHSQLLFADNNTLWVASQQCANGVRQNLFAQGNTTQAANYNCLTRFDLSALTASIVPAVNQGSSAVTVPYPNTNQDQYYYGSLTSMCWVQNYNKVYTAYGGQIHAFNTADGSEINNINITVQGTALSVAYMDALTNAAN